MNRPATPDRLRAAAWAIVRDEGLAAATSRRITEEAGANLQAITYHFGSKDALLGEALVEQLRDWTAPFEEHGIDAAAVPFVLRRFASDGDEPIAILRAVLADHEVPGLGDAFATWLDGFRRSIVDGMRPLQDAGEIPGGADLEGVAGLFTALALGVIAQRALDPGAPATDRIVVELLRLLSRAAGASG